MKIRIKYFSDKIDPLTYVAGKSDWIDLRAAEKFELKKGEFYMIPLGVAMEIPKGFEAHIVPRSSSFKKWGFLQTNSMGLIDNTFCGDNDQWMLPIYATRDAIINVNDRICQFRIERNMPEVEFEEVEFLGNADRGGFGSTGTK